MHVLGLKILASVPLLIDLRKPSIFYCIGYLGQVSGLGCIQGDLVKQHKGLFSL